jgi:hypothetical protein
VVYSEWGEFEAVPFGIELLWVVLVTVPACENSRQGQNSSEGMLVYCEPQGR